MAHTCWDSEHAGAEVSTRKNWPSFVSVTAGTIEPVSLHIVIFLDLKTLLVPADCNDIYTPTQLHPEGCLTVWLKKMSSLFVRYARPQLTFCCGQV